MTLTVSCHECLNQVFLWFFVVHILTHFVSLGRIYGYLTCAGGSIYLLVILLMFTISTIIGQLVPSILELMTAFIGAVLMITAGSLTISYHTSYYPDPETPAGLTLGALAISAGILFLVDFILNIRKLRSEIKNNEDSKTNSGKDEFHEIIFSCEDAALEVRFELVTQSNFTM